MPLRKLVSALMFKIVENIMQYITIISYFEKEKMHHYKFVLHYISLYKSNFNKGHFIHFRVWHAIGDYSLNSFNICQ